MDWRQRLSVFQQPDDGENAANRVVDVGKVEGMTCAFHVERSPKHRSTDERRDDTVRMIPQAPVDVGEADGCGLQSSGAGCFHELFALDLCAPVDVDGPKRCVLGDGQTVGLSVDLTAADKDDPGSTRLLLGCGNDVAQSTDIDIPTGLWVALPPYDPGNRREMDDSMATGNGVEDAPRVSHIAFFVARSPRVESDDTCAVRFERHAKRCPDQSFRTGDQYSAAHFA